MPSDVARQSQHEQNVRHVSEMASRVYARSLQYSLKPDLLPRVLRLDRWAGGNVKKAQSHAADCDRCEIAPQSAHPAYRWAP